MTKNDVPKVTALLSKYLSKFTVAPILSEAEVEHYCFLAKTSCTLTSWRMKRRRRLPI